MKLPKKQKLIISPTSPFNFDATFHKPDHFSTSDNYWSPGIRWQTMIWQDQKIGLKIINQGSQNQPKIEIEVYSLQKLGQQCLRSLKNELIYRYSLDLDLSQFNQRFKDDPQLKSIIGRWKGMRPMHHGSLYEYLIIMVMLQNCTVRRSINMLQALFENYGTQLEYGGKKLWAFWLPKDLNNISEEKTKEIKDWI